MSGDTIELPMHPDSSVRHIKQRIEQTHGYRQNGQLLFMESCEDEVSQRLWDPLGSKALTNAIISPVFMVWGTSALCLLG
jgi:hypothetical protein